MYLYVHPMTVYTKATQREGRTDVGRKEAYKRHSGEFSQRDLTLLPTALLSIPVYQTQALRERKCKTTCAHH